MINGMATRYGTWSALTSVTPESAPTIMTSPWAKCSRFIARINML